MTRNGQSVCEQTTFLRTNKFFLNNVFQEKKNYRNERFKIIWTIFIVHEGIWKLIKFLTEQTKFLNDLEKR